MEQTIFERIIARQIPATIEYEDDEIIVIRDIAPSAPVHLLIIPKRAIASLNDLTDADAELVGRIHLVARTMAHTFGIADSGYRVVTNCNDHGGQTVFHLHFHLLGGEPLGRMNSVAPTHQSTSQSPGARNSSTLRDVAMFMIAAIGLAIGFNSMNPKSIAWVKPEFDRQAATQADIDRYLSQPPPAPMQKNEIIQQAPVQEKAEPQLAATTQKSAVETSTPAPTFTPEPGIVREIKYDMFVRLLEGTQNYLIDARGADKFAQGHINGAVNFFGGEVQSRIPDVLSSVPRDRVILIYCDGGECELSHHVADVLKQFGYGPVFIFTGGWAEWTAKRK